MFTVLHLPYTYYPDAVGGTEIYVEQLTSGLNALGIRSVVVAPGKTDARYEHAGTTVYRLGVSDLVHDLNELYGEGDTDAGLAFERILRECEPDIVHLHAFTRIVSVRLVEAAHAHHIPVVFTYHTPTVSCLRSGLMLWGREPCDGRLEVDRCTSCRLHSLGLPEPAAKLLARTPEAIRRASAGKHGGVWTALRMHDLVARQHAAFHDLMNQVDLVIALAEWTRQLLVENGVPREKIRLMPHTLANEARVATTVTHNAHYPKALRIVSLGRLERIKGMDLLVDAFEALPELKMTLDIYGISQEGAATRYAAHLRERIGRDARIRMLPPVPHAEVVSLLSHYDVLAVPSQWFETGPLVVLEAFAAGIPVLGSNLGGIAEKIRDGVDGLLLPSLDSRAWRGALCRLVEDTALLQRLRSNVCPPGSEHAGVRERADMYLRLAQQARERAQVS